MTHRERFATITHLAETDSTNRYLRDLGGSIERVVVADYQTAGRGCGTNTWESERGKNLLFSVLCHPVGIEAARQFFVSMAIAMAFHDVLSALVEGVSVKWPNDIYVGDRKICGILIENQLVGSMIRASICGAGLNVNQARFVSDAPNPVSLLQLTGREHDREALLHAIMQRFDRRLTDEHTPRDYRAALYRRQGIYSYRDAQGQFEARFLTVEDDGHLLLCDTEGRERRYAFKELTFLVHGS